MFCMKCGRELPNDAFFCDKCGEKVGTNCKNNNMNEQPLQADLTWKPVKGIFLNAVSIIVTITGIVFSLFFAYVYIETEFSLFNYKSEGLRISLFSIYQFTKTLKDIFGNSASDYILPFQIAFVICIIDIVFAVIMLIIRLTRFKNKWYNSSSSYVPIAAPVLSLIFVIIFNNDSTFEMFTAVYPIPMILSIVLFITNIVICEIGLNFNWEMSTKEKKERTILNSDNNIKHETEESKENKWDCVRCGWENKENDKYCQNCGKKQV